MPLRPLQLLLVAAPLRRDADVRLGSEDALSNVKAGWVLLFSLDRVIVSSYRRGGS